VTKEGAEDKEKGTERHKELHWKCVQNGQGEINNETRASAEASSSNKKKKLVHKKSQEETPGTRRAPGSPPYTRPQWKSLVEI